MDISGKFVVIICNIINVFVLTYYQPQTLSLKEKKIFSLIEISKIIKFNTLFFKFLITLVIFTSHNAFGYKENYYYEVQFGNFVVGKSQVFIEANSSQVILNSKSKTAGFLDVLYKYEGDLYVSSVRRKKKWFPKAFSASGTFNNKIRSSKIDFGKNLVKYVNNPVLDLKKVHPINESTLIGVIDPITAFFNIIEKINAYQQCDEAFKIFDGRRRYDLKIKSLGITLLENDRPKSYNGKVVVCGLKVKPLGGHRLETKWRPNEDKFTDFKIFFGETSLGRTLPVRMELERWFGTIIIRLINNKM